MNAGPDAFQIDVSHTPQRVTVALIGEVDLATAEQVSDALRIVLLQRPPLVEVDLAGVTFIDSSGIGAVLRSRLLANSVGAAFRCIGAQPQARKAIDILQLAATLGIVDARSDIATVSSSDGANE
jgi:anti-anti-sigma factor